MRAFWWFELHCDPAIGNVASREWRDSRYPQFIELGCRAFRAIDRTPLKWHAPFQCKLLHGAPGT
jgi:hypothetical protein